MMTSDDTLEQEELEFESYFDRDSGAWSLRRIPSSAPVACEGDDEDECSYS